MRSSGFRLSQIGIAGAIVGIVLGISQAADPPAKRVASGVAKKPEAQYTLWAATDDFVFRSADRGGTWVHWPAPRKGMSASCIEACSDVIWVGTDSGLFRGKMPEPSWEACGAKEGFLDLGLLAPGPSLMGESPGVSAIVCEDPRKLWVALSSPFPLTHHLARSEDGGKTWRAVRLPGAGNVPRVSAMLMQGGALWVGLASSAYPFPLQSPQLLGGGIWRTVDGGRTWASFNSRNGLSGDIVLSLFASRGSLFAVTDKGVDVTCDGGQTWRKFSPEKFTVRGTFHPGDTNIQGSASFGGARSDQEVFVVRYCKVLSVTHDGGKNWEDIPVSRMMPDGSKDVYICLIQVDHGAIVLGVNDVLRSSSHGGLIISSDDGRSWSFHKLGTLVHGISTAQDETPR